METYGGPSVETSWAVYVFVSEYTIVVVSVSIVWEVILICLTNSKKGSVMISGLIICWTSQSVAWTKL